MDDNEYKLLSSDLLALIEKVIGNKTDGVLETGNNFSNNDNVIKDVDVIEKEFYPESFCEYRAKNSNNKRLQPSCKRCRKGGVCSWWYYCVLFLVSLMGITPAGFVFYFLNNGKLGNCNAICLFLFGIVALSMTFMAFIVYSFVRLSKKDIESKVSIELKRTEFKYKMEQEAFHLKNMKLELYKQEQEQVLSIRQKERMAGIEERQRAVDMCQKSSQKSHEWVDKYMSHLESIMKTERNDK